MKARELIRVIKEMGREVGLGEFEVVSVHADDAMESPVTCVTVTPSERKIRIYTDEL